MRPLTYLAILNPHVFFSFLTISSLLGNQFHRFQNFINSAYLLAEHTKENIELLIIEWNPPEGTRRVYDVLVPEFSLLFDTANIQLFGLTFLIILCSDFAALNISPTELSQYQKHCTTSSLMWVMPRCTSLKAKILAFVLLAENMLFVLIKVRV